MSGALQFQDPQDIIRAMYQQEYDLNSQIVAQAARDNFAYFISHTMPDYDFNWHHDLMAAKLDAFAKKEIPRLMIFMPPRHGKSQQGSRHLPGYIFGINPSAKIIAGSHSAEFAHGINLNVQNIIDSDSYHEVFPDIRLCKYNGEAGYRRTQTTFDIVGTGGFYTCAGVGGNIIGKGGDYILLDDIIKSQAEADSPVYRDKVYRWYISTLYSRREKNASILLIITRWHEDDIAGRLLEDSKRNPAIIPWEIISLPAIKEHDDSPYDKQRKIGDALWPAKYDLDALEDIRHTTQSYWYPLYQQSPKREGGNIIREDWFNYYDPAERSFRQVDMYVDTAYTENVQNDRTAIITYCKEGNNVYITHCAAVWEGFPGLIDFLGKHVQMYGNAGTRIYVEPKASGQSVVQYLKRHSNLNVIQDKAPTEDKIVRAKGVTPFIEAGRIYLPKAAGWLPEFMKEVTGFPKEKYDDIVDAMVGAINKSLGKVPLQMEGWSYPR